MWLILRVQRSEDGLSRMGAPLRDWALLFGAVRAGSSVLLSTDEEAIEKDCAPASYFIFEPVAGATDVETLRALARLSSSFRIYVPLPFAPLHTPLPPRAAT